MANLGIELQSPCHEKSSQELQILVVLGESYFWKGLLLKGGAWKVGKKIVSNVHNVPLCLVPNAEHKV